MSAASLAMQWVLGGAFAGLGVVTTVDWLRHRDAGRRFLTLSIALLGVVGLLDSIAATIGDPGGVITDVTLVLFVVSGWAFFRFRDGLVSAGARARRAVDVIVAITTILLLAAYAPTGGSRITGPAQDVAALVLLVVWAGCVGEPLLRFWRLSRNLPSVQRARLRALVEAYGGIVLVLVLSVAVGLAKGGDSVYRISFVIALLVVPLFYAAFAPPLWLRRLWREREEEPFRQALNRLLLYSPDRQTLAERAVDWAARLVGAEAAVIATDDGRVLAMYGLDEAEAWEIVRDLSWRRGEEPPARDGSSAGNVIRVQLRSDFGTGLLAVRAGPLTPLFSGDEVSRLREYGSAITTALDRVLLVERLRRNAELLDLAYNPIFTWSVPTGLITYWNRAAEQLYGYTAQEAVGRLPADLLKSELPISRDDILREMLDRGRWTGEMVQTTKSGRDLKVSARWALQRDALGEPDLVLEVNRDVTQERRNAQELREARDEAERASAAKSEYLSRMSHELRTPLTAILGYSDLLELRDPREDQMEAVAAIQQASSHLLSLVNDVLDIARIEAGRETLAPEPVSVAATVEECLRLVTPAAEQRNITLVRDLSTTAAAYVSADRQRLVQALLNLLSNAVKYSGDGARITVSGTERGPGHLRLAVADNGPGLSDEQRSRLFQPFDRLGAERTTTPGTGLGLALTKKLVEAMDGVIGVDTQQGSGATFWIDLATCVPAALEPEPANGHRGSPPPPGAEQQTVLYVEDNLATVSLMEEIFSMRPQIRLITSMQGSLALDLAREHRPDLVVLDLHLPDLGGDEVLRRLRADPETAAIPVVMFSADATERQVKRLLAEGASHYLLKPAKVTEFLEVLDSVLAKPAASVAS